MASQKAIYDAIAFNKSVWFQLRCEGQSIAQSDAVRLEASGNDTFILRSQSLVKVQSNREAQVKCTLLFEADAAVLLTESGQFLNLDTSGTWCIAEEPCALVASSVEDENFRGHADPSGKNCQIQAPSTKSHSEQGVSGSPIHGTIAAGTSNSLNDMRKAQHERWLKRQSGQKAPDSTPTVASSERVTAKEEATNQRTTYQCAQSGCTKPAEVTATLTCMKAGAVVRGEHWCRQCFNEITTASANRKSSEPEGEPTPDTGWGEAPARRRVSGPSQMAIVQSLLRNDGVTTGPIRFMRDQPECVLYAWVEKMALCIGNAGHDQRNNLRFAAVALERRNRGLFGGGGHFGGGFGLHGMGGGGHMSFARVEENKDHPDFRNPRFFQKIDALSGQVEGLSRGIITSARCHCHRQIREKLIPAALGKVQEMESLTQQTVGADQDESQRAEMRRIIGLQRCYLQAVDASLGSCPRPGLPKPDDEYDFSIANLEVSAQVTELTTEVEEKRRTLDSQKYLLLSRIACNTGHQLQNLAAYCAEDPSCREVAGKIDNLGGQVEDRTRSMMVLVHRHENAGMPISSRRDIAENCRSAWDCVLEVAKISNAACLRNKVAAAEIAPTLARLRKSVRWLNESALLEIERELSFLWWGPNLTRPSQTPELTPPANQAGTTSVTTAPGGATLSGGHSFDVVIVGAGPAGVAAADAATERGLRCAIVEPRQCGLGTATGFNSKIAHVIISDALHLGTHATSSGQDPRLLGDIRSRLQREVPQQQRQKATAYGQREEERLRTAGIAIFTGCAQFTGRSSIHVSDYDSGEEADLTAEYIVVCTGARPRHPSGCHVDGRVVHDYKTIEQLREGEIPASIIVLGGGVIACETACYMAAYGVRVTLLAPSKFMKNIDSSISEALLEHLRENRGIEIRTDTKFKRVTSDGSRAVVDLEDGSSVNADAAVFALGSTPNTEWLGCDAVNLKLDRGGSIQVDANMRTNVSNIFACGDCCSRGGLLSLARQHGLVAAATLHKDKSHTASLQSQKEAPAVLWTIPEVAMVGVKGGRAGNFDVITRYTECDRGIFDEANPLYFVKLVYEVKSLPSKVYIRGVHIFGVHAEKIISRGVELIDKTLDEGLGMALPAAATLEELYTINLRTAAKRTADLKEQQGDGCSLM